MGSKTKAREIMTAGADYLKEEMTAADAAKFMASAGVGAAPICDTTGHLRGVVTDRDITVKVVAEGKSPEDIHLGDLVQGEAVTIGADDSVDEAIKTMEEHKVRRLPVIDGTRLIGMISQADVARNCPPEKVGNLVAAISDPG